VRCGETAAECALKHVLPALGGTCTRTRNGVPCEWSARCPACHAAGKLTLTAKGRTLLRYCHKCEASQEALTAALSALLPCFWPPGSRPSRQRRQPSIEQGDLTALALADVPPMSLRLYLLEMDGMSTPEALDKLGVRRENRARVIKGRASISMQNRR
jgi:hypothetical protein